jgi:putative transposase
VRQKVPGISERRACRTVGQPRSTQRKAHLVRDDEAALNAASIRLTSEYGRYGYRRITALLRAEGWRVNAKRVQRIWRREGLKVPSRQPKRGRLWLHDGSCIRLRPEHPNHVWAYDFVADRTVDGRPLKMLTAIDEFSRQRLAITVARRLNADEVLVTLTEIWATRLHPIRQRRRIYRRRRPRLAQAPPGQNLVYRTRQPLGKWLRSIFQRQVTG